MPLNNYAQDNPEDLKILCIFKATNYFERYIMI